MKRALALLLVSLLAGALVAQDGNDTLRGRVRAMRAELERRAAEARQAAPDVRYYDVAALLVAPPESQRAPRDLLHSYQVHLPEEAFKEPVPTWEPDRLLEFVVEAVGLDADIRLHGGILRVGGTPETHRRLRRLVEALAERTADAYVVDFEIVPAVEGDQTLLADVERVLPARVAADLARRSALAAARVNCTNGAEQAFGSVRESGYLAEYDVEVAREALIATPRTSTITEGITGDLMICADHGATGVLAHVRVDWQRAPTRPRTVDTQHGPMDLPMLDVVRLHTSAWLPLDRPVLLATCTRGLTPCHIVVRVRLAR